MKGGYLRQLTCVDSWGISFLCKEGRSFADADKKNCKHLLFQP
jgi:hypothetical protein